MLRVPSLSVHVRGRGGFGSAAADDDDGGEGGGRGAWDPGRCG